MSNNLFSDHLRYVGHSDSLDVQHSIGSLNWWTNAEETISRLNPMESPDMLAPAHMTPKLRPGRGLTYLIKCSTLL